MRLIDADALKAEVNKKKVVGRFNTIMLIDNAPTATSYTLEDLEIAKNNGYKWGRIDEKKILQGDLIEKLKDRIEESVCNYCPKMNRHCELCEISRVFSIIELTNEEMKGGES